MWDLRSRCGPKGFTLLELMVVVTLIILAVVVGYPAFDNWLAKSRVLGTVQSAAARMRVARQEAIKINAPAVVQPDFDTDQIIFFINVDQDAGFEFNPDPTASHRTADYELGRMNLPTDYQIRFWAAGDQHAEGHNAVEGFTPTNAAVNALVFQPDGTVLDPGALRIADGRGNFFELRIAHAGSGNPRILKYHPSPPWGGQAGFFPRGRHRQTGDPMWAWY